MYEGLSLFRNSNVAWDDDRDEKAIAAANDQRWVEGSSTGVLAADGDSLEDWTLHLRAKSHLLAWYSMLAHHHQGADRSSTARLSRCAAAGSEEALDPGQAAHYEPAAQNDQVRRSLRAASPRSALWHLFPCWGVPLLRPALNRWSKLFNVVPIGICRTLDDRPQMRPLPLGQQTYQAAT